MIKILIGIAFLIGIYFYMQKYQQRPQQSQQVQYGNRVEPMKNNQRQSFIPSDKFVGAKNGYVFKMDSRGLGYYLDAINS
tara:strand:- start:2159 stop:2398 length:240 start_codon:yes stop_codon:yes gene_type:complete